MDASQPPASPPTAPRRHGIFLLPNLFTTGGLFAGFYAIIAAMNGHFPHAAMAVFVAAVLDGIDGRVARLTNTQSAFGVQYDSLADLVSFGLAPALVMYCWSLETLRAQNAFLGKLGWGVAFLYAACAAVRLARFNTQVGSVDKRYFIGLASPAAASLMMSFMWAIGDWGYSGRDVAYIALGITAGTAVLMISRLRYWSFKSKPGNERVPFLLAPLLIGGFVLLAIAPPETLLLCSSLYALSGFAFWALHAKSAKTPRTDAAP